MTRRLCSTVAAAALSVLPFAVTCTGVDYWKGGNHDQ